MFRLRTKNKLVNGIELKTNGSFFVGMLAFLRKSD